MTGPDRWLYVLVDPARHAEPTQSEVAQAFARGSDGSTEVRERKEARRWRRRGLRFNIVLAIIGTLLLMTAIAVASGLITPGAIVPLGGGGSEEKATGANADRGSAIGTQGGERGDHRSTGGGPGVEPPDTPIGSGPPEERQAAGKTVRSAYEGLGDALRAGAVPLEEIPRWALLEAEKIDAFHSVCELLSSDARREAIDYAFRSSGFEDIEWTCEKAVALLLRTSRVGGTEQQVLHAELISINVDGDRATATLRIGKDAPLTTAPLVREDGEWRIGAAPGQ